MSWICVDIKQPQKMQRKNTDVRMINGQPYN